MKYSNIKNMKKQVIVIHGGDSFDSHEEYLKFLKSFEIDREYFDGMKKKGWKATLDEELGDGYEVVAPQMPCKGNAKYAEWKIWFDKLAPFFEDGVMLVGHSMGGIFLAKYLSETTLPKKITAVFLVAAPYDTGADFSLADFILPKSLEKFGKQVSKIFIYQSKDDSVVPFENGEKYKKDLPDAKLEMFNDKGHFNQEKFPELVQEIKSLAN